MGSSLNLELCKSFSSCLYAVFCCHSDQLPKNALQSGRLCLDIGSRSVSQEFVIINMNPSIETTRVTLLLVFIPRAGCRVCSECMFTWYRVSYFSVYELYEKKKSGKVVLMNSTGIPRNLQKEGPVLIVTQLTHRRCAMRQY